VNSRSQGNSHLAPPADACRPVGRPRSEAARLRILAAARELLDEQGFRSMTMEAIAERANTSKVTLYKWWSHKAAVVLDAMLAEVSPIIPYRDSESPLESLRDQMKGFTRFLRSRKAQLLIAVLAEGVLDEKVGDAFRQHWVRPRRADARVLLARAVEAGELRADVDVDVVLDALFGPLYYRALVNHLPLDPLFGERVFHCVVTGIATEPARVKLIKPTKTA
jgi:AcrR family transcriptional regulator